MNAMDLTKQTEAEKEEARGRALLDVILSGSPKMIARRFAGKGLYRPEFCAVILEEAEAGKSTNQIAAKLGIATQTLYAWSREYPEVKQALEIARTLRVARLEDRYEKAMDDKTVNPAMYIFGLKAADPATYSEHSIRRVQIDGKVSHEVKMVLPGTQTPEEFERMVAEMRGAKQIAHEIIEGEILDDESPDDADESDAGEDEDD